MPMRLVLRWLVITFGAALLILPAVIWYQRLPGGLGFFTDPNVYGQDIVYALLRLAALLAFTLIFIQITTQTFKRLWRRLFNPAKLQKFHQASGIISFSLALAHPVLLATAGFFPVSKVFIPQILSEFAYERTMALGTLALYALIISVGAALMRKKIPRLWRSLHMFNYLVFYLILLHSLRLGSELQTGVLRYVWLGYAAIVVAGQIYRIREGFRKRQSVNNISPTIINN